MTIMDNGITTTKTKNTKMEMEEKYAIELSHVKYVHKNMNM